MRSLSLTVTNRNSLKCPFRCLGLVGLAGMTSLLSPVHATADSLTVGTATLSLSKALDLNRWSGAFSYRGVHPNQGSLELDEELAVILHQSPGYRRQWKVNHNLDLSLWRNLSPGWAWQVVGNVYNFHDQNTQPLYKSAPDPIAPASGFRLDSGDENFTTGSQSNLTRWHLGAGTRFTEANLFDAELSLGPVWESRGDQRLSGVRADLGASGDWSQARFEAGGWMKRLSQIRDHGWSIGLSSSPRLSAEGLDNFSVSVRGSRQREYSLIETAVGNRQDQEATISNRLTSGVTSPLRFAWVSRYNRKLTTHQGSSADYSDRESQWENGLDLALHRARSEFKVVGGIDLQDLKYNLTITQGRRLRLGCESSFQPTTADSLHLNLQAIRYRFDTPDLTDLNDRDELRYLLKAGWSHQIISTLSMDWDATVDLNHLVYLFRPRSSENRWARLFSIECAMPWKDDPLTNVARFAVVANYTAYDFAPSDLELSRAYRSFTAEDSLTLSLSRGWTIEFETSLLKDDNGRMRWDEWVQNVSEDGYAVTTTGMLSHRIAFFQTALGWSRYFRRTDLHSANGERTSGQWVESRGPVFACFQNADQRGLSWNFQGSWLWVEDRPHGDYTLPDIKLILDYTW